MRGAIQGDKGGLDLDEDLDIEESWTFIGDESDPELQRKMQELDISSNGRAPRVSMDGLGLRSMQGSATWR